MVMPARGYSRLAVDERRSALLACGRELFAAEPYDELSMSTIARAAGISKALLYHYFPSKQAFFIATLQEGAHELADRVRPDEDATPGRQLDTALGAWLEWVDGNRDAYGRLMRSTHGVPDVREVVDDVREATTELILTRLMDGAPAPPVVRAAVCGWLWFMDAVCLEWCRTQGLTRDEIQALLRGALVGALEAAAADELAARLA